jgi:hypothetical protein
MSEKKHSSSSSGFKNRSGNAPVKAGDFDPEDRDDAFF